MTGIEDHAPGPTETGPEGPVWKQQIQTTEELGSSAAILVNEIQPIAAQFAIRVHGKAQLAEVDAELAVALVLQVVAPGGNRQSTFTANGNVRQGGPSIDQVMSLLSSMSSCRIGPLTTTFMSAAQWMKLLP